MQKVKKSMFVSLKNNNPSAYSRFMAYNKSTGEMFVNYWISSPYNNFYLDDRPFTHWAPVWIKYEDKR